MEYLQVKNWNTFQQYKDREPKWIKVYRSLLNDYKYDQLSDSEFGQLVKIWLLASQMDNSVPNDPAWIQRKTGMNQKPNIKKMLQMDFLQINGNVQECTEVYEKVPRDREDKRREDKNIYSDAQDVLLYLNKKIGKNFQSAKDIEARLKQGGTVEECKQIIDTKLQDPHFQSNPQYYHPSTLFRASNWDKYINQKPEDFNRGNKRSDKSIDEIVEDALREEPEY